MGAGKNIPANIAEQIVTSPDDLIASSLLDALTAGANISIMEIDVAGDKKIQITSAGGTDANAIHDNVAAEISAITEKTTPVDADLIIIEDSADSNNKKRVQIGNITTTSFPEFQFFADQVLNPNNADWTVNELAPAGADTNNNGLTVRRFDDTTEEGIGMIVEIPSGATNIIFDFVSRAETSAGSNLDVVPKIYVREMSDNAAVESWSSGTDLTTITMGTSNEHFQYDSQTITLASESLVAGSVVQIELTRNTGSGSDTLSGDWTLLLCQIRFS